MLVATTQNNADAYDRKHKIDVLMNNATQLSYLEKMKSRTDLAPGQVEMCNREIRRVKNRFSALKSREKKRAKLNVLQNQVVALRQRVEILKQENWFLQHHQHSQVTFSSASPPHDFISRQTKNVTNCYETNWTGAPAKRKRTQVASTSSSDLNTLHRTMAIPSQETAMGEQSIYSQVYPRGFIPESAAPAPHSVPSPVGEKRCSPELCESLKTLRLVFCTLWKMTQTLVAKNMERRALDEYLQKQEYLMKIFYKIWKSLLKRPSCLDDDGLDRNKDKAVIVFNRISRKFVAKALNDHYATEGFAKE